MNRRNFVLSGLTTPLATLLPKEVSSPTAIKFFKKKNVIHYYDIFKGKHVLHREDGPAVIKKNLSEWYKNGKLHRENGPAVEWSDGSKWWFVNGKLHRENGPAIELTDGNKEWFVNGKRHREDGPAVIGANGNKYWWLNNELLSKKEFDRILNK